MQPTPPGWPRLSSAVFYDEPRAAIAWLVRAFGFEIRMVIDGENGAVAHSELTYGEAMVMVGGVGDRPVVREVSPRAIGGRNTQSLFLYVDDVEAHFARARDAGATILQEPTTSDYGPDHWSDRGYECLDPEGHRWWFAQRLRTGP